MCRTTIFFKFIFFLFVIWYSAIETIRKLFSFFCCISVAMKHVCIRKRIFQRSPARFLSNKLFHCSVEVKRESSRQILIIMIYSPIWTRCDVATGIMPRLTLLSRNVHINSLIYARNKNSNFGRKPSWQ